MKARRSMLFVPGDNPAMLSTAFVYKPDSVMFDLEDAVSPREKDSARLLVFHALSLPAYQGHRTSRSHQSARFRIRSQRPGSCDQGRS